MSVAYNVSANGLNAMANISPVGATIIVFVITCLIIFLMSKNFRRFVFGSIITSILTVIYKLSSYVGLETSKNNFIPVKWFGFVIFFIIISIIIGKFLENTKFVKKIEKNLK